MNSQLSFINTISKKIDWELPNLKNEKKLWLDTETDGLKVTSGINKAVGLSIATTDRAWYIPFDHKQGFNYELENVKKWVKDNLYGKEIACINTKFDNQSLYNCGINFESLNVCLRDVAYHAALTDSKRKSYSLADLAIEHSTKRKIELPFPASEIYLRSSEEIYDYACMDASLLVDIESGLNKIIIAEDLTKVRDLEDSLIYAVCHMERNGAIIDRSKLEQWQQICTQRMTRIFWKLASDAGFKVEPTKSKSVANLCAKLGIIPPILDTGAESITNDWLQKQHHPLLQMVFEFRKLLHLKSNSLDKYLECIDSNNKIRYNLNQLKADKFGTVTGRFSSSGSRSKEDEEKINIQNVTKVDDEEEEDLIIEDMRVRELFIPEVGYKWVKADASQLQFRIFSEYSQLTVDSYGNKIRDERLIKLYQNDPNLDFHYIVNKEILKSELCRDKSFCDNCTSKNPAKGCGRGKAKHENFGNLFGMGVEKGARRLGVSIEEYENIKKVYSKRFPAVKRLSYQAQGLARNPELGPNEYSGKVGRGYIRTLSGRRRRYNVYENLNSAMNAVIQGTEADLVKVKLKELYDARKEFGLNIYFTVHDEFDGGIPNEKDSKKINELLNDHTSYKNKLGVDLKVPIIWDVKVGENWNL